MFYKEESHLPPFFSLTFRQQLKDARPLGSSFYSMQKYMYVCAKSLQSCLSLCDPMECTPSRLLFSWNSPLQARTLEWSAMPYPRDLPDPGIKPVPLMSPTPAGKFYELPTRATWEVLLNCRPCDLEVSLG